MVETGFTINPKLYDFLKWMALVVLPGFAALYASLGPVWNFSFVPQVVATITAIDTFLGIVLGKAAKNHAQQRTVGEVVVMQDPDGTPQGMKLVAYRDPLVLDEQDHVSFQVRREQTL